MKIPEFMLPDKCAIQPFDESAPSGPTYLDTVSSIRCRIEKKRKWAGTKSQSKNAQWVYYTNLFFNYSSSLPAVPIDSLVTFEGDDYTYKVVGFKKMGGFINCHWQLVLQ